MTIDRDTLDATLDHAREVFGLAAVDLEVIELLFHATLGAEPRELRVRDAIAALAPASGVAAVLGAIEPTGALASHGLLSLWGDVPFLDRRIALTDAFWPRLLGHWPRELPRARAADEGRLERLVLEPVIRERALELASWLRRVRGAPVVLVRGPAGTGKAALARAIAGAAGFASIEIDGASLGPASPVAIARDARWQRAAVVIADADGADPGAITAIATLVAMPVLLTSVRGRTVSTAVAARPSRSLDVPATGPDRRAELWRRALEDAGVEPESIDCAALAGRFRFGAGRVEAAVKAIVASPGPLTTDRIAATCRELPAVEVGGLAQRVELPYQWDDLVVPPAPRRELELIVTWGQQGAALFAADGPGSHARPPRGLVCLFHGPPGTGKTMAAQVLARHLGLELYRVDLSQVVDKYVGETEKRLDRLFDEADAAGCVLLFDEADALFAKRAEVRDARDRYANLETGFLLQRLEEHRGLCILASNLQRSIDAAFFRRFGVVTEFPVPGAAERRGIWERLLPPLDRRAADIDVAFLADRFAIAGGDIRNAVFAAVLFAGRESEPLGMRHLVVAAWRELVKVGRLVDARDLEPWRELVIQHAVELRSA